jgi:hypothetical protein
MTSVKEPSDEIKQGMIVDRIPWPLEGPKPLGIVLSNPCDLEHNKASYLIVAALIPAKETIQLTNEFINRIQNPSPENHAISKKKWDSISDLLESYIHNKNIVRYYFIDARPIIESPLFFVDFQLIISIPIDNANHLEKIAQLPSPFVEQMIMHFSSYTSRIGSDRLENDQVEEILTLLAHPYHKI